MASLNKVHLIGNLTRDPEVRYTPKGTAVCDLGLALNSTFGKGEDRREETTFVDVTVWGTTAENVGKYLIKGRQVCVVGRLSQDEWKDRDTGQKRSKLKVVAEEVVFIGGDGQRSNRAPSSRELDDQPEEKW